MVTMDQEELCRANFIGISDIFLKFAGRILGSTNEVAI